jgi:hypothetical protein
VRTFLLLQLDSEGSAYSDVVDLLEDLGFRRQDSGYDFVYEWPRPASVRESLEFGDRVQAALRGQRVYFRLESTTD